MSCAAVTPWQEVIPWGYHHKTQSPICIATIFPSAIIGSLSITSSPSAAPSAFRERSDKRRAFRTDNHNGSSYHHSYPDTAETCFPRQARGRACTGVILNYIRQIVSDGAVCFLFQTSTRVTPSVGSKPFSIADIPLSINICSFGSSRGV